MAKREKFGKFVLLDEIEASGLGTEYRAAKLGAAGLEKVVALLRLGPGLSGNADVAKHLMDQAKAAAQLQNPNIAKIFGIGKVDASYYISYEFIEGKSLKSILSRCRRDGFPFSVDHTLLIASKICSALEYAHGRKSESGIRYYHGLVNPGSIFVSYEGEVRVRGFGYWPSKVRDAGALRDDETIYLSPEQAAGGSGDTRSDIYAVGAILYETLTGQPLGAGGDVPAKLAAAKLQSPTGEDDSLPKPIAEILGRAVAQDPTGRYAEIAEMRKAIDTMLFSGDFTPTTFNLAFFMHSLFREDIDKESKQLKEDKEGSYFEFLTDDTGKTLSKTSAPTVAIPTPPPPTSAKGAQGTHIDATIAVHTPVPVSAPHHEPAPPAVSAKEAAAGFTFHKDEPKKSSAPLMAGAAAVLLILGVGGYFLFGRGGGSEAPVSTAPAPTTLSAEAAAAAARMKDLEDKLKTFEAEKAAAEQKAADDAKKKLEAQAKAAGTAVDPAAVAKAQEEAAKKARAEQERKQQEERKKLAEAKAAEEARVAEEQRKADELAKAVAAAAAATTTLPAVTAPPSTVAAVKPGTLVNLTDAGVTPPITDKTPPLVYPAIALRQRIEGTVELSILVDEKGAVTDAQVVTSAGGRAGLDEAAIENAKKRRYRPATKEGVPVKVWMPLRVVFKLPTT
jgi:TonB family protein